MSVLQLCLDQVEEFTATSAEKGQPARGHTDTALCALSSLPVMKVMMGSPEAGLSLSQLVPYPGEGERGIISQTPNPYILSPLAGSFPMYLIPSC